MWCRDSERSSPHHQDGFWSHFEMYRGLGLCQYRKPTIASIRLDENVDRCFIHNLHDAAVYRILCNQHWAALRNCLYAFVHILQGCCLDWKKVVVGIPPLTSHANTNATVCFRGEFQRSLPQRNMPDLIHCYDDNENVECCCWVENDGCRCKSRAFPKSHMPSQLCHYTFSLSKLVIHHPQSHAPTKWYECNSRLVYLEW